MEKNDEENDVVYIFVDFNDQLSLKVFEQKVFLRIANLTKHNPLVQLNDLVFKGHYEESVGTNLFFEEIENPAFKTNAFEKETPIKLQLLTKQTKVIKLKQMKFPRCIASVKASSEPFEPNLKQDINTVLDKIEKGTLTLDLMVKRETVTQGGSEKLKQQSSSDYHQAVGDAEEYKPELGLTTEEKKFTIFKSKYEKLKKLARRPVKRAKSPELNSGADSKYQANYEFDNLKCLVLKDDFIEDDVDVDRSALCGLIERPIDPTNELTEEQLNKIVTFDNFRNLSLKSRYLVLKECLHHLDESDEGRDVMEKLVKALQERLSAKKQIISQRKKNGDEEGEEYMKLNQRDINDLVGDVKEIYNEEEWANAKESNFRENWDRDNESE